MSQVVPADMAAIAVTGAAPADRPAAAQSPVFTDQVSGEPIDGRLDPQAREIAIGAAKGGGLPAEFAAKRATRARTPLDKWCSHERSTLPD